MKKTKKTEEHLKGKEVSEFLRSGKRGHHL